jgi:hypothetical protein
MENTHLYQKKATGVTVPTHVLDSGQKIGARTDKQILLYKAILKPIRTYGVTLWGTACHSKIEILKKISKQGPQDVRQRPLVHTKQSPTHRSTDVNRSGRNNEIQQQL